MQNEPEIMPRVWQLLLKKQNNAFFEGGGRGDYAEKNCMSLAYS